MRHQRFYPQHQNKQPRQRAIYEREYEISEDFRQHDRKLGLIPNQTAAGKTFPEHHLQVSLSQETDAEIKAMSNQEVKSMHAYRQGMHALSLLNNF